MYNTILSSLLFFSYVSGMFPEEYAQLATQWGVYVPIHDVRIDIEATVLAAEYCRNDIKLPLIEISDVAGYLQIAKLVNSKSESLAIGEFVSWVKKWAILETRTVSVTSAWKPMVVNVKHALEYTIYGGITAQPFPNCDNQYIVLALFDFGYSTEYDSLSKAFGGSFPAYNQSVEMLARRVAASPTLASPLEQFKGLISWAGGYCILLIRGMTVMGKMERDAMHLLFKRLHSKEAWNALVSKEELSILGTYDTLSDIMGSQLEMFGGISITKIDLDPNQKEAMQVNKSSVYSVCAYFKLIIHESCDL